MSKVVASVPVLAHEAKPNSNITRHTATFHPTIWGDYFLSYAPTLVEDDSYPKQIQQLKENVKRKIVSPMDNNFSFKLNFINSIQRLGISYHFEYEIDRVLHQIYNISTKEDIIIRDDDLHHLALLFRLLRQRGYSISSDVFLKFKDQAGNFNEELGDDIQGMLSLYEATQLRFHGEEILEEAHNFALNHLSKSLTSQLSPSLVAEVHHSLEQSLRRGMPRLEARYYISFYQEDPSRDENLLTFAMLDFNMLQKLHQKEISSLTKWWVKDLNVSTKFPFVRDRIVEGCFWIIGVYFEPEYSLARRIMMKVIAIASIIDDVYDAYGTIEELELLTNAIERWDVCSSVDLPESSIKLCYMALLDVFDEIEQELTKLGKAHFVNYAKNEIKRLVQAYMTEATWFHCNHTPTIEEYMEVAIMSCGYAMLTMVSFLGMEDTTEEVLIWVSSNPKIIVAASTISRLMDDIVGSEFEQKRGHVVSSLDCYMKEYKISRQEAIEELAKLVESAWKDINEACLNPTQVPMPFLLRVVNLARMMDVLYKEEDNYTNPGGIMKDYIKALLVNEMSAYIN